MQTDVCSITHCVLETTLGQTTWQTPCFVAPSLEAPNCEVGRTTHKREEPVLLAVIASFRQRWGATAWRGTGWETFTLWGEEKRKRGVLGEVVRGRERMCRERSDSGRKEGGTREERGGEREGNQPTDTFNGLRRAEREEVRRQGGRWFGRWFAQGR